MRVSLPVLAIVLAAVPAAARPVAAPPKHPAVVRVVVPEGDGMSLGSGALVAVSEEYGLVVTNWHVVRDGSGVATVIFPDGFRSTATVVRVDRDWDLAALLIWRPRVRPIPLSARRPAIGEPLWIAGYGRGEYRISGGECTHYLSPGGPLPFDMIELSTQARQGDSGGPILNQQGELAGVLFGASWGKTSGSHCLRVREFLNPVLARFDAMPRSDGAMLAQGAQRPPSTGAAAAIAGSRPAPATMISAARPSVAAPGDGWTARPAPRGNDRFAPAGAPFAAPPDPSSSGAPPMPPIPADLWDQAKGVLAIVGLLAICFHTLRWLGK